MNKQFGKVNNDGSITLAPDVVRIITTLQYEWDDYDNYDDEGNPVGDPTHHVDTYDTVNRVFPPTAEDYKKDVDGPWLPNVYNEPSPLTGYHVSTLKWVTDGKTNTLLFDYEKTSRIFSKFKLEQILFQMGLLDKIDEFIDSLTLTNEHNLTMPIRRAYDAANEFDESHPLFAPYLKMALTAAGVDDKTLETILAASVQ